MPAKRNSLELPPKPEKPFMPRNFADRHQEELAEIINEYKTDTSRLSDIEQLVNKWRNRNSVQKSFHDKQAQISLMKKEYEQLQQKMNDNSKTGTAFERFKNIFSKSKSENQDDGPVIGYPELISGTLITPKGRPVSNISLQSNSS